MKLNKVLIILVVSILLVIGNFTEAAALEPWPECGDYEITITSNFENEQLKISDWLTPTTTGVLFESYDGWILTYVVIDPGQKNIILALPPATNSIRGFFPPVVSLKIILTKPCSTADAEPHFTGRYVYTLLGNYPCNLISEETTIPARFLNPDYTAPLCSLPDLPHSWNGEWVKNKEMEQNGFFTGGNHYDTSLD